MGGSIITVCYVNFLHHLISISFITHISTQNAFQSHSNHISNISNIFSIDTNLNPTSNHPHLMFMFGDDIGMFICSILCTLPTLHRNTYICNRVKFALHQHIPNHLQSNPTQSSPIISNLTNHLTNHPSISRVPSSNTFQKVYYPHIAQGS